MKEIRIGNLLVDSSKTTLWRVCDVGENIIRIIALAGQVAGNYNEYYKADLKAYMSLATSAEIKKLKGLV